MNGGSAGVSGVLMCVLGAPVFEGKNREVGENIWGLCLYVIIPVNGEKVVQGRGFPYGVYNQRGMWRLSCSWNRGCRMGVLVCA